MSDYYMEAEKLAEEVSALRQQLAECQTMRGASVLVPQAELEALKVQLAEAKKDAERYRWLRDNGSPDNGGCWVMNATIHNLDAAIDQAMRGWSDEILY